MSWFNKFLAPTEVATQRQATCNECPAKSDKWNQCTACGCFLVFKTKLATAECPLEAWEK